MHVEITEEGLSEWIPVRTGLAGEGLPLEGGASRRSPLFVARSFGQDVAADQTQCEQDCGWQNHWRLGQHGAGTLHGKSLACRIPEGNAAGKKISGPGDEARRRG